MIDDIIAHLTEAEFGLWSLGPNTSQDDIQKVKQAVFMLLQRCLVLDGTIGGRD